MSPPLRIPDLAGFPLVVKPGIKTPWPSTSLNSSPAQFQLDIGGQENHHPVVGYDNEATYLGIWVLCIAISTAGTILVDPCPNRNDDTRSHFPTSTFQVHTAVDPYQKQPRATACSVILHTDTVLARCQCSRVPSRLHHTPLLVSRSSNKDNDEDLNNGDSNRGQQRESS